MTADPQAAAHLKTLSVLYVEDQPEVREEVAAFLRRRVGALHLAGDGAEGLAAFREHGPQLVVTDIRMPGQDGLVMAGEIRKLAPAVPIVVTTAFEQTDYLQRSIEAGVNHYVLKPIHADRLEAALLDCARRLHAEACLAGQRQLEAELRNQAFLTTLLGGIGHDFNNLLTAVLCSLDTARIVAEPGSRVRNLLDSGLAATDQARDLSRRLLRLTRPDLGARRIGPLEPLVRRVVAEDLGPGPAAAFDFPEQPLRADHDPEALAQALGAVVANAREAMAGGGVLRVTGGTEQLAAEAPLGLAPGRYVHLAFRDSGPGMAPEVLARAFEPYFTTRPRTAERGQGLGLAVCEAVVRAHRGRVWAESAPGAGTTVHVLLPMAEAPEAPAG
jgi:signal transduction histidine kinase